MDLNQNPTFEEEIQRCKFYWEDLEKRNGWKKFMEGPDDCYWVKTFDESIVPTKIAFTFEIPVPAHMFGKIMGVGEISTRRKWDKVFEDIEVPIFLILQILHEISTSIGNKLTSQTSKQD